MPLSTAAIEHRREYDRRYRREHRHESRETLRRWQSTPMGKLRNQLCNAEWRHRRRPSDRLAATIARLEAEIERLRGDA